MDSPLPTYLDTLARECTDPNGEVASYIPELARVDPDQLGLALSTTDGTVYTSGDADVEFTIQSISKAFVYALALEDRGLDGVLAKIGVEPSGDPFNELSLDPSGRPTNPMINAGAIIAHTLVDGADAEQRVARITDVLSRAAGRDLVVDEEVCSSELDHADRNLALAYMMHSTGVLEVDPQDAVTGYTRQCSLSVTARDLAVMAATLANDGVQPSSRERMFGPDVMRQTLSVMFTCGMYDAAGDWASTVGIPAKSGVGGGIIGALPGQLGMATFSPRLDDHGNSASGVRIFQRASSQMGLHLMDALPPGQNVIAKDLRVSDLSGRGVRLIAVQGVIDFNAAEKVTRRLCALTGEEEVLALDLRRVASMNAVAQLMLGRTLTAMEQDGTDVQVIDPERILAPERTPGAGRIENIFDVGRAIRSR